jgi:uncharacterized membrane protein
MKNLFEFLKTTLVGGILILAPIYLLVLLLLKALLGAKQLLAPVIAEIPAASQFPGVVALLVIIAACFLAGLVVRTGTGERAIEALQHWVLEKIPGYKMLRGLVYGIGSDDSTGTLAPALVEIEEALVPAVIVEELPDGQFVVLVPSVPTPIAGALYILPAARVHRVNVPLRRLLQVYTRFGEGTGELFAAMETARPAGTAP